MIRIPKDRKTKTERCYLNTKRHEGKSSPERRPYNLENGNFMCQPQIRKRPKKKIDSAG